jgi:hypothetical protein
MEAIHDVDKIDLELAAAEKRIAELKKMRVMVPLTIKRQVRTVELWREWLRNMAGLHEGEKAPQKLWEHAQSQADTFNPQIAFRDCWNQAEQEFPLPKEHKHNGKPKKKAKKKSHAETDEPNRKADPE